jgi:hypothetical protein
MDNKINAIGTCKGCGIEYDMDEVGRVYGYESSVYTIGYCSAICYTNSMTKKEDMDNKLLCTEGDSIGGAKHTEGTAQLSKNKKVVFIGTTSICSTYGHSGSEIRDETNAQRIVTAWNSHDDLVENLARLIDRIEEEDLQSNFPSAYQRAKECLLNIKL